MAAREIPAGSYLKWEHLRPLLEDQLGADVTRPRMAEFLNVNYVTFWRLTKSDRRFQATPRTVEHVLAAFPNATYDDLFEAAEPRVNPKAATKRGEAEDLFTVAEVARKMRCSEDHVRRLIRNRELGYKNIGIGKHLKLRIPESAYVAYASSSTRPLAAAS